MPTPNRQSVAQGDYTAIVYFHGMGKQRRYEELSRLVDVLDKHAHESIEAGIGSQGQLARINARLEPNQNANLEDRAYIRVAYKGEDSKGEHDDKVFRFHEVYWAPLTAGVATSMGVLKWLLKQVLTPLKTLLFTPWRSRLRLRSAALFDLRERNLKGEGVKQKDYITLLELFNEFEGSEARRDYPKGSFTEFIDYVKSNFPKNPNAQKRLTELTMQWRRHYVLSEISNLVVVLSLIVGILLAIGGIVGLALMILSWLSDIPTIRALKDLSDFGVLDYFKPTVSNAIVVSTILFSALGVTRFLRDYMGDVQLWTTYEENEVKHKIREEILNRSVNVLSHVLLDPFCKRVVVVSHSLGTTIALDCLLEVGKINRARNLQNSMIGKYDLEKIDHFITMGSPIDKVHYFFESHKGKYHRYNRVVEEIRGDIGYPPFCKNRNPSVHWINFWDSADIISGRLNSPASRTQPHLRVDNIHVRTYRVPRPGKSHLGYFYNNAVIKLVFDVIFKQAYSFAHAPKLANNAPDYASQYIGSELNTGRIRLLQYSVLLLPWVLLACVVHHFITL